jgi:hypothetical protein
MAYLRWDDIDLPKRTIIVRRLKGSTDSVRYLERDEVIGLKLLRRQQQGNETKGGPTSSSMSVASRSAGWALDAWLNGPGRLLGCCSRCNLHMLRHSTGSITSSRSATSTTRPPSPINTWASRSNGFLVPVQELRFKEIIKGRSINIEVGYDTHHRVSRWMHRPDLRSPPYMRCRPRLEGLELPVG